MPLDLWSGALLGKHVLASLCLVLDPLRELTHLRKHVVFHVYFRDLVTDVAISIADVDAVVVCRNGLFNALVHSVQRRRGAAVLGRRWCSLSAVS